MTCKAFSKSLFADKHNKIYVYKNNESIIVMYKITSIKTHWSNSQPPEYAVRTLHCSSILRFSTEQERSSRMVSIKNFVWSPARSCIPSKRVTLILIYTIIIGMMYAMLNDCILVYSQHVQFEVTKDQAYGYHVITMILLNLVLAFFGLFYPLAGFVGDIYTGRFKIVMFGFEAIWIGSFIVVLNIVFTLTKQHSAETITGIASVVLFMIGISCYRSNIIQFGFDQLMDMPSCYLSMFVHWYFWADSLGNFGVEVLTNIHLCFHDQILRLLACIGAFVCPLIFTLLLMVIYTLQKRGIFNTEPVKSNPYKLILKVLVFAWKNKRPVRPPSAFVYGDRDVRPSRLNLAKERFGGPFQNSDVEDVKTFTRVLRILITLLPLFILRVPVSDGVFLLFTLHAGTSASNNDTNCTLNWIIMGSGTLSYLTQVVFFPIYIWIMFSVLRNRVPKILTRITFAGVLYILAVTSMLIIDLTGHIL